MLYTRANACGGPDDAYIAALTLADGTRSTNFQGSLTESLLCNALPGSSGCGFNQNLESMQRALDGRNGSFLRQDAMLAVAFLVDEDDCSAHNDAIFDSAPELDVADSELGFLSHFRCFDFGVQCEPDEPRSAGVKEGCAPRRDSAYLTHPDQYARDLKALKVRDEMLATYAFMADLSPLVVDVSDEPRVRSSCDLAGFPGATPATRIASFVRAFSSSKIFERCQTNVDESFGEMSGSIISGMESLACASEKLADVDETQPGIQSDCKVVDVIKLGRPDEERQVIPACTDSQPLPCYRFDEASLRCEPGRHELRIERDPLTPATGFTTIANCVGAF